MGGLTIHEASATTGWSPRMLRYIESVGLIEPARTDSGYRVYGAGELQRLRTLRELIAETGLGLGDVAFAARLQREPQLASRLDGWLGEGPAERPEDVEDDSAWLRWEQEKHQRLLAELRELG